MKRRGDSTSDETGAAAPAGAAEAVALRGRDGREGALCAIGIVAALVLVMLFPGDIPWIKDEPWLIGAAMRANAGGRLAAEGIVGSQRVSYGPLPTWIYQGYLLFSRDMVLLSALRGGAFVVVMVAALWRIAKLSNLTLAAIPVFLLSPFLWLYAREIWDNTFSIPLSLLAVLAYLEFLRGRKWALFATVVACGALLLIHFMCVPLLAAISIHAMAWQRAELWRARLWGVLGLLVVIACGGSYFWTLLPSFGHPRHIPMPGVDAVLFSLSGGNWFSFIGWPRLVGGEWWSGSPAVLRGISWASAIAHLFVIGGTVAAVLEIARMRQRKTPTYRQTIAFLCVITICVQAIYFGMAMATGEMHYYNASWFAYAGLIWIAIDWMLAWRWLRYVPVAWAAMLLVGVGALSLDLHRTHGTRSLRYGPTLANLIDVSRALDGASNGCAPDNRAAGVGDLAQRLEVISQLDGAHKIGAPAPDHPLVRFAADDPRDGRIEVVSGSAPVPVE